jgi:hypothetical protein
MTLEDTLTRSLHDHLDEVVTPRVDVEAVRRAGERRRAVTTATGALVALAVVVGGVALTTRDDDGRVVQPAGLPALDFDQGLRAWYDDDRGQLHLGGGAFDIGLVQGLDTQASATPWGVVWTGDDQSRRILRENGSVELLAPPVEDGRESYGNVKYDAVDPRIGWLTRDADGATLTVHSVDGSERDLEIEVPCQGAGCGDLAIGGLDHDRVLVRRLGVDETLVLDLTEPEAGWSTIEGFRAADVRNRVVLGQGTVPADDPLGDGWRFVRAEGPESLLTFDGAHELYWSAVLRSTEGGEPLRLDVPEVKNAVTFVNLDSDGSVMVALRTNGGNTYLDCDTGSGRCVQFDTGPAIDGGFLGNDM